MDKYTLILPVVMDGYPDAHNVFLSGFFADFNGIGSRFIFSVFAVIGGFSLSLLGWKNFDNQRQVLGSALIGSGLLLGAFGFFYWAAL